MTLKAILQMCVIVRVLEYYMHMCINYLDSVHVVLCTFTSICIARMFNNYYCTNFIVSIKMHYRKGYMHKVFRIRNTHNT